jgi:hypothetical protein
VQDFPATLRGQEPQFELLPDEGPPHRGELILPDAPQALVDVLLPGLFLLLAVLALDLEVIGKNTDRILI